MNPKIISETCTLLSGDLGPLSIGTRFVLATALVFFMAVWSNPIQTTVVNTPTSAVVAENFLTAPFYQNTATIESYVDLDPSPGVRTWTGGSETYDGHPGTDFLAEKGTEVLAAASGKIFAASNGWPNYRGPYFANGNFVVIDHGNNIFTAYHHLDGIAVDETPWGSGSGKSVKGGQVIGYVGNTGLGPNNAPIFFPDHLHFQVWNGTGFMNSKVDALDPFRDMYYGQHGNSPWSNPGSLWTKDNDPQYPIDTRVRVGLVPGWNLVSLPEVPNDQSAALMLKTLGYHGSLIAVWAYTATSRTWQFFIPGKTSTLTKITDGSGYWFNMKSADVLCFDGTVIPPTSTPPSYPLAVGWNLIGFKPQPNPTEFQSVGVYLSSITGSYDLNNVWVYENAHGSWARADSSYMLQPGQAMWILITAPATLRP